MATRITVTATKPLYYEGRSHVRGSVFTATPVDAAALKYRGKAKLGGKLPTSNSQPPTSNPSGSTVPEHPSITRRLEPVKGFSEPETPTKPEPPMPANEAPVEQVPDAPASAPTPEPEEPRTPRRGGRAYRRRDMQAETSDTGE